MSKRLSQNFKVYTIDQRNHGRSPHSNVMNYQSMASDLHEFMQNHEIPNTHILGHSMGGKTAMEFALNFPKSVNRLIVVDIAPKTYHAKHDEILEALCTVNLKLYTSRKEIDKALSKRIKDVDVRQFLLTNLRRTDSGSYTWRMNLNTIQKNYKEILSGLPPYKVFNKPTLFIRGEDSSYIEKEDQLLIKKIFVHSEILTIHGTNHWVHTRAPDEFFRIVTEFLNTHLEKALIHSHQYNL